MLRSHDAGYHSFDVAQEIAEEGTRRDEKCFWLV